jgi:sugar lactone lactonase YvrE
MKIGSGSHTYEWIEFGKLPAGKKLGYTHGVVTDAKDNVYVHNQSEDAVCVFDPQGNFIKSWGKQFKDGAHGMFLSTEGGKEYLYFADYAAQKITKTTLDGAEIFTIGQPPRADIYDDPQKFKPTDVCVAPNGDFYVFDGYGQPWVHRYSADAKYKDSFGGDGTEPGKLKCPHGGWVDTRKAEPELYVADRGNNRIQVFTLDGKHKRFITDEMKQPCCFFQFKDEMVIPDLQARVTILDKNDKPVAVLGDDPQAPKTEGWPNIQDKLKPGKFSSPHACCVDSKGDIYVVEWISTGRVTKLVRQK